MSIKNGKITQRKVWLRFGMVLLACLPQLALAATASTANFTVNAPTAKLAQEIAAQAEKCRKELAIGWVGQELPTWSARCPISAAVADNFAASGETSFLFEGGEAYDWQMTVQGSRQRVLDSVIPHEVTHTIFASYFRQPLPRWADEGACTTVEDWSERSKHQIMLVNYLQTNRGIGFDQLFAMRNYPSDVMPLYSEGYSLAEFLIEQKGRREFVNFLSTGLRSKDWPAAVRQHYGDADLSALQTRWLAWVKDGSPSLTGKTQLVAAAQKSTSKIEVLEFSAVWCGPCQEMRPIVAGLQSAGYPIRSIDVDANRQESSQYNVSSIPCFIAIKDGREVGRLVGTHSQQQVLALFSDGESVSAQMRPMSCASCGSCGSCGGGYCGPSAPMVAPPPRTTYQPTYQPQPPSPPQPVATQPAMQIVKGDKGDKGDVGPVGPVGPPGAPGEVSQAEINTAAASAVDAALAKPLTVQIVDNSGNVLQQTQAYLGGSPLKFRLVPTAHPQTKFGGLSGTAGKPQ